MRFPRGFSLFIALLLGLLTTGVAQGKRVVEVHVWLDAGMPDQLSICRHGGGGQKAQLDSVWMDRDGWYKLRLEDFRPGLYTVKLGAGGHFPLLLTSPKRRVKVWVRGDEPLTSARVTGADEAQGYVRAYAAQERYGAWAMAKSRLEGGAAGDSLALSRLDRIVEGEEARLCELVDELGKVYRDTTLSHFLGIIRPVAKGSKGASDWFPLGALRDSTLVCGRELSTRLTRYFLAQRNAGYTHEQQLEAFDRAMRAVASLPMCRVVAKALRGQVVYLFAGSNFDPLADSVMVRPFGPLAAIDLPLEGRGYLEGESVLSLRVPNLQGEEVRVISRKSRYTLVLIWSVWCGHCQTVVPAIYDWWGGVGRNLLRVTCVSIDSRSEQLEDYIRTRGWAWDNCIQHAEAGAKLDEELGADGTPSMFVYDAQGQLISRPGTLEELQATFRELGP